MDNESVDACPACGFEWDDVPADQIIERLTTAARALSTHLDGDAGLARQRPEPARWSMLEYASHVRDVIINLRDRIILGAVEDNPDPKRMYADDRVDLGLYEADQANVVADELAVVAELFGRTFDALSPQLLDRPIHYAWPVPATRTLLWVAAQTVHEAEHHLADVAENRRRLGD